MQFFDNGMQIGSDQIVHSINAGGNGTAQVTWTAAYGSHNISVMVDPSDGIVEGNETNNIAFTSIAIGRFTVDQAGNSWVIEPVIRGPSIADFYDYRSASSHTGFEEPYISKIYLYQCNTSGELGLIIHHHKDNTMASSGRVKMDLQDVPAYASVAVADDRSSEFSLSQEPEGNWDYDKNTDGGAITLSTNEPWSITVIPDFITGNNAWRLVNGDGNEIELDMGEPIVISYTVPAPTPSQYTRTIYIKENSGNDLTDYQVLINLSGTNFPAEANESGADIRFVDENGTVLNYWIEEYNCSAKDAKIWVKVPEMLANKTVALQMCWGNPSATPMSDGDAVFEFFDDFSGTVLGSNKWHEDAVNNIDHTIHNYFRFEGATRGGGYPHPHWIYDGTDTGSQHRAKWAPLNSFIVEWDSKVSDISTTEAGEGGVAVVTTDSTIIYYITHLDAWSGGVAPGRYVIDEAGYSYSLNVNGGDEAKFSIVRDNDNYTAKINDMIVDTYISSAQVSKIALAAGACSTSSPYLDYVQVNNLRVRKYADSEPTVIITSVPYEWSDYDLFYIADTSYPMDLSFLRMSIQSDGIAVTEGDGYLGHYLTFLRPRTIGYYCGTVIKDVRYYVYPNRIILAYSHLTSSVGNDSRIAWTDSPVYLHPFDNIDNNYNNHTDDLNYIIDKSKVKIDEEYL